MVPIKIKESAKKYVETNKDEKLDDVIKRLEESLERKNSGVKCSCCKSSPIWALGSALGGFEGCFTCIACETDDSSDYEVI
ncbi:hypothetical protein [Clostridium sp. C2-6-12]|uniref:hypothetical protein n=1 Tax=Clostridium sp. C2-6-12 TaxID=2698832 RepID=UPI00136E22E1|nr:hypothetical protein [Clostridium sp. C2-6-12]